MQEVRLRLALETANETTLCLEPWGDAYPIRPGAAVELVAVGPEGDSLELQVGDDHVTVWAWPGATVRAFQDGAELGPKDGRRPPVPTVPGQMTVRTFAESLFSGASTAQDARPTKRRAAKISTPP